MSYLYVSVQVRLADLCNVCDIGQATCAGPVYAVAVACTSGMTGLNVVLLAQVELVPPKAEA